MKEWISQHSIVQELGMTYRRFEFIWRNFRPSFDESSNDYVNMNNESQTLQNSRTYTDVWDTLSEEFVIERIQVDPSKLVFYRNHWIPIIIQVLSIIQNNAYIIHHSNMKKDTLTHKEFSQGIRC